ncbi:hypothetical protein BD769DRAFT_1396840 [Suillus cothurnatus]|nr:hypothetical protein BD769DRAFT_1396840 [Suillus cothurnatus]
MKWGSCKYYKSTDISKKISCTTVIGEKKSLLLHENNEFVIVNLHSPQNQLMHTRSALYTATQIYDLILIMVLYQSANPHMHIGVKILLLGNTMSPTKTQKVCIKVASYLEQGQCLENLSWQLCRY